MGLNKKMKETNEDKNFLEFDILFDFDDHFIILDDFQISVISYISYLLTSYLLFIKKKRFQIFQFTEFEI